MRLLHDRPESSDIKFGHKIVSDWLAERIDSLTPPFRLAITGGLGTGKSTIVTEAIETIKKSKADKLAVSYVDVWKLDKESVRRSALLRIAKDLLGDPKAETKLREALYGTFSDASYIRPFRKTVDKVGLRISLALLIGIGIVSYMILSSMAGTSAEPWWWKALVSLGVALTNFATRFLEKSFVHVQRTFTKAPMIGAEEFESGLQDIIESPKLKDKLSIVIFDNIDRASPESSKAILAGISAFFDHSGHDCLRNVLIVVPYDPARLRQMIEGGRPVADDCEKMFDAIIALPRLTDEDLTDFAYEKFKDSLEEFNYDDETLWNLAYLVSVCPFRSPRDIKHIVNQLVSKLSLAQTAENSRDERLKTNATLLPSGTVTGEPDTVLKLIICEKILPTFTEQIVQHGLDLKDVFDTRTESQTVKDLQLSLNEQLFSFLQASLGIPKNPPSAAAPFLYLKGPDQVLAIPAGHAMTEALKMGAGDKLELVLKPNESDSSAVSQKDIAAVIAYHRKKNSKNSFALENAVRATDIGLRSIEKFEKQLAIELCELMALTPNMLSRMSPAFIDRVTGEFMEVNPIQKLWKMMGETFSSTLSKESLSKPEILKWNTEYLVATFQQADGVKRSGIKTLPLSLLGTKAVYESLGESYPKGLTDLREVPKILKLYLKTEGSELEPRLSAIVREALQDFEGYEGFETEMQDVVTSWQSGATAWFSTKGDEQLFSRLSAVLYFWPTGETKLLPYLNQIKDWVSSNHANFNSRSQAGFADQVIDILISLHEGGAAFDGNHDAIMQTALGVIDRPALERLREIFPSWKPVWSIFETRVKNDALLALDRTKSFDFAVTDNQTTFLKLFIQKFPKVNSKLEFTQALINTSVALSDVMPVIEKHESFSGESRIKFIELLQKLNVDEENQVKALVYFATHPDVSNKGLIDLSRSLDSKVKKRVSEGAIDHLMKNTNPWGDSEVETLKWTLVSPELVTDLKLKDIIQRAVDQAVQGGATGEAKRESARTILTLWYTSAGCFDEKTFRILRDATPADFKQDVEAIGEKFNVKDSVLNSVITKITDVVEKVVQ